MLPHFLFFLFHSIGKKKPHGRKGKHVYCKIFLDKHKRFYSLDCFLKTNLPRRSFYNKKGRKGLNANNDIFQKPLLPFPHSLFCTVNNENSVTKSAKNHFKQTTFFFFVFFPSGVCETFPSIFTLISLSPPSMCFEINIWKIRYSYLLGW